MNSVKCQINTSFSRTESKEERKKTSRVYPIIAHKWEKKKFLVCAHTNPFFHLVKKQKYSTKSWLAVKTMSVLAWKSWAVWVAKKGVPCVSFSFIVSQPHHSHTTTTLIGCMINMCVCVCVWGVYEYVQYVCACTWDSTLFCCIKKRHYVE